jgi:DNA polymerase-3 subunit beta
MKFSCEKFLLQNATATASRAAAAKSPIPALEGLLIEAGKDVKVTGYDLKKGVYTYIEADVAEPGSIVLGARLFGEMIRRMPDGIVTVSTDETGMATVKCGKTEFSFMSMDPNDYPELPTVDGGQSVTLPQKMLKSMINETIFAVSDNDSRPVYMGTLFAIENGELSLVSVDGYRLALRREKLESSDIADAEFIVPGAALSDVERVCGDSEDVEISVGAKHISFTVGKTVIVSRRLEGDFLNYKKAIPENFRSKITVEREEFMRAVDRVSLIIDEKTKNPIRLTFGDGTIDFLCVTPIGKAEDVCSCDGACENLEIGFNDRYLMEALKAAPAAKLDISLNTGSSPCILTPAEGEQSFVYMILPVRLRAGD